MPYAKPSLSENTGNVELGAAPLAQYYSVFSARPSLGYGTLTQCSLQYLGRVGRAPAEVLGDQGLPHLPGGEGEL